MATSIRKKTPRFYGLRIFLSSTILYYWLVLPFLIILSIKYAPDFRRLSSERGGFTSPSSEESVAPNNDLIQIPLNKLADTIFKDSTNLQILDSLSVLGNDIATEDANKPGDNSQIGSAFNFMFNALLISFFLGFVFNLPFKRYFSRKRKGKPISPGLFKFCKRFLLKSPIINAGILGLAFLVSQSYMLYYLLSESSFENDPEKSLYIHFFFISLTAAILSLMFVFFWQKHRVHLVYMEHIFEPEELRKRIFRVKAGRIRNRMFLSSAMTTLLPLTIVLLYLYLSITNIGDMNIKEYTDAQKDILFGDYVMFTEMFSSNLTEGYAVPGWLFYINAINSFFMFIGIYSSVFIAFVYILFLVKWTTADIVLPVKELLINMRRTGRGELDNYSIVRTNDEIGELSEGYNEMTTRMGNYIQNISKMNEAYSHFVPRQFLDFLGKESIVDIKLGDQVEKEMTVLFSDIRSFTELSEKMTPKENFDFINYYLGYMEPVIRSNDGFIDKYIGDSIMALFGNNAEDAISAAIDMRIKLSQFNQVMTQFNKPTINSGIGIHNGKLMLGIVGSEGRMDGTVISDAVNLASRLEGLTKLYGSSIIISQDTLISLNTPSRFSYRFLDIVKVKGKNEAVYIFEVLDGDPEDIRMLKLQTKETFGEGIKLYKSGSFSQSKEAFKEVFTLNQHDMTAALYISRCKHFIENGVPEDWDGIKNFHL